MTYITTLGIGGEDVDFREEVPVYEIPDVTTGLLYEFVGDDLTGTGATASWIDRLQDLALAVHGTATGPTVFSDLNGHKYAHFDGAARLGKSSGVTGLGDTASVTIVAVLRSAGAGAATQQVATGGSTGPYRGIEINTSNQALARQGGGGGATSASAGLGSLGTGWRIAIGRFGDAVSGQLDGAGIVTSGTAITGKPPQVGISLGGTASGTPTQLLTGDIAHLIYYSRELTALDMSAKITELQARYGI